MFFDQTSWETGACFLDLYSGEALLDCFNLVGCLSNDFAVLFQIHEQLLVLEYETPYCYWIFYHVYFINNDLVFYLLSFNRTVYIHGFNKMDFALWHCAITLAAGTDGKALSNQQLTKNGVPIIVDSCIAFVTQYGELHYIY